MRRPWREPWYVLRGTRCKENTHNVSRMSSRFISSAPPGQVDSVLRDLSALEAESDYSQLLMEYHVNANSIFESLILTKHGHKGNFSFDDPNTHSILELDPANLCLLNSHPYTVEKEIEDSRAQVQDAANRYIKSYYSKGVATVYGGSEQFMIYISTEKYNPENYWNGKWVSEWKLELSKEPTLQGNIKVYVHYFEDGNVQLKQDTSVSLTLDDSSLKNVFKAIQKSEHEIHSNLIQACSRLCDNSFKGLRRALPLTKAKMDWSSIGNYKLGSELEKS